MKQNIVNDFRKQQDLLRRARFWAAVINDPASVYADAALHPYVAATYSRSAKRNLAKILKRHPGIAQKLEQESSVQVIQ